MWILSKSLEEDPQISSRKTTSDKLELIKLEQSKLFQ